MKSLIDKFTANTSRWELLILAVPFVLWIFCFLDFFTGRLPLFADAISYSDHIRFFTDNLSKGVYPLWDPTWDSGAPNDFFLRRIGDVNPFFFLLILFKWLGIPSVHGYLALLGVYYFLAGLALYLITRVLLADRFFAFMAYVLFLFSSWGSEIFYNYIIIIFVPIIWFFYFLLSFFNKPQKWSFLGACYCVGLVLTTYIPFFFLIILSIALFFYILFYSHSFLDFLKRGYIFIIKNRAFTFLCIAFLIISFVPGLLFYKESKSGTFVLPNRHSGADLASSAMAVSIANVASGDIISHGYFDRLFDDHSHMDMGDVYIPYVFFLILLCTAFARSDKLIFFLIFNILALSLITITSAADIHQFLYAHLFIFKFIRQIYYFFWLAMLPMAILLSVSALKSLLTAIDASLRRRIWLFYIIFCHLIFALFLCQHQGVLWGAWAAVAISLAYFMVYFRYGKKISYPAGFFLILLAVFMQSAQVNSCLEKKLFRDQPGIADQKSGNEAPRSMITDMYYAPSWFTVLVNYIDPHILSEYRNHLFILYDNVIPYNDGPEFYKALQKSMASHDNIAFVSGSETVPDDYKRTPDAGPQADMDPVDSGKLTVVRSDANTWVLNTHLATSQFLVINDNYDAHWHALINGQTVRLFRANVSFKGVWVPSGDSSVVLRFSTPDKYIFHLGLLGLFAGLFIYLIVLIIKCKEPEDHV